jgi:asparagine synthase (glutamine-hydrolysing)
MCGIVGTLSLADSAPIEEATLRRMLGMIRHRGPDQFGIYVDEVVGLGSARLSILDLEGGQQPIANEDESLWIVFNGEVFNYPELRIELETEGHRFRTKTDTEVCLHLFEKLGPACLERLNGQFAVAIWDRRTETLFLARDRLGVRPLFYALAGEALVFGSEIKAILGDSRVSARIDPLAMDEVFTFWSTLPGKSVFQGISEVPPGHYLVANREGLRLESYWRPAFSRGRYRDVREYVEELRDLLTDATRIRLRADVPVGAYLSGGLDSATITAIARQSISRKLETFSIAFTDSGFDESEHQERMAKALGTNHHVLEASHAEIGRVFPEVIWHTEVPVLRTAPVPMFLLSKLVHDHGFKVVLTGEGADELLVGYDIFKEMKIRRFWARRPDSRWRPLLLRRLYTDIADLGRVNLSYLSAFFRAGLTDVSAPDYSHSVRWRNTARTKRFFSAELRNAVAESLPPASRVSYPPEFAGWDPLQKAQFLEMSLFLPQYLLSSQGDRVAMAHSVEGRFPFLDHRVAEFCGNLPSDLKLRVLKEKVLLRLVAKDWVPEEIRLRPKRPYRAPIRESFFGAVRHVYLNDLLSAGQIKRAGLFEPEAVRGLVAKAEGGLPLSETDEMALAGILSTQILERQFVSGFESCPPVSEADDLRICVGGPSVRSE